MKVFKFGTFPQGENAVNILSHEEAPSLIELTS